MTERDRQIVDLPTGGGATTTRVLGEDPETALPPGADPSGARWSRCRPVR